MTRQKAIDLVAKLLRTADPKSGASENERTTAALEAARLIAENRLVAAEAPPKPKKVRRSNTQPAPYRPTPQPDSYNYSSPAPYRPTPQPDSYNYSSANWTERITGNGVNCEACGKIIPAGHAAFWDADQGWRCYDISCK